MKGCAMEDKTFFAKYIAEESQRLNESLQEMIARGVPPTDEEKEALIKDMETGLSRLTQMITEIQQIVEAEENFQELEMTEQ